jgi:hypothetical protein
MFGSRNSNPERAPVAGVFPSAGQLMLQRLARDGALKVVARHKRQDERLSNKPHDDAVREISARVLAQLHQLAKRGRIQRTGRRVSVSWVMPPQ